MSNEKSERSRLIAFMGNHDAFNEGQIQAGRIPHAGREGAFPAYRQAVENGRFDPCISASVCFVAGYLGNVYPSHDSRVTT